jgi:hypothetical protein
MEYKALIKNKAENNAVTTNSDTKRNIQKGLSFTITLLYSIHPINKLAQQS